MNKDDLKIEINKCVHCYNANCKKIDKNIDSDRMPIKY